MKNLSFPFLSLTCFHSLPIFIYILSLCVALFFFPNKYNLKCHFYRKIFKLKEKKEVKNAKDGKERNNFENKEEK